MSDLLQVRIPNTEGAEFAEAGVQAWINSGVLVPVERCRHGNIDPHREYEKVEEGPFGAPMYELAVICPGSPTLAGADDG